MPSFLRSSALCGIGALGLMSLFSAAAGAAVITNNNPDFEYDNNGAVTVVGNLPDNGSDGNWNSYAGYQYQSTYTHGGTRAVMTTGTSGMYEFKTGVATANLTNAAYALTFYVFSPVAATGTVTYSVDIRHEVGNTDTLLALSGSYNLATLVPNTWTAVTATGVAPDLTPTQDAIVINFGQAGGSSVAYLDDAMLTVTTTPEPASLAGLGLICTAALSRRRRQA